MKLWKWFAKNDEAIRKILLKGNAEQKAQITEHFDQHVLDLGRFSWEIIDDGNAHYTFIISPNREREKFVATKNIIAESPKLDNWTFLPAKPADKAMKSFEIYDEAVNLRTFQPSRWLINSIAVDGKCDILVHSSDFKNCDLETSLFACEMALASFLGEEVYINKIGKIRIVEEADGMIGFETFIL